QAEDGIRDFHVTGVQTCALPIYDADPVREDVPPVGDGPGGTAGEDEGETFEERRGGDHERALLVPEGEELNRGGDDQADEVDAAGAPLPQVLAALLLGELLRLALGLL